MTTDPTTIRPRNRKDDLACFVHIEKAAGMTLHAIFRNNWPLSYLSLTPWHLWSNELGAALTAPELAAILKLLPHTRGIGGHTIRSFLDYDRTLGRSVHYITILREPVSRYISHFNYQRNIMKKNWSIYDFLDEPRFNNYMTVRIAGCDDPTAACEELENRFRFVGLLERFDESLILMREAIGLPDLDVRYEKINESRNRHYDKDPALDDPDIQARIRENNAADLEVYAFVRDVLYPRFQACYQGELANDLDTLERSLSTYRFPRLRRFAWNAYRHAFYRHVEWFVHQRFR